MADSLRYGEPDWNSQPTQLVNGEIMQRPVSDKSYEELRFDQLAARNFSMRDHPRLNSLGRHQDSLTLRNQDVLTVTAGAGDPDYIGTWKIHEILLTSSSKFAEAAMKHPTIEKQTRTIHLSSENPDIFERYVKWLYSGFIDTADHELLIHMYKLGERMLDDKFQDVCYSILRASLRPYAVSQILYILHNVLEHDRLHKLCLSEVGRGIVTGKYNFDRSELDELFEFMPDLMRAVMDDVAKRSAFGQVHSNKAQPASIFSSSQATATQQPLPPPMVATQHPPAVTATHYTPNIGWHFTSTAPNQPSSSTGGSFGTTSSAATAAPATSSTGTPYGPGLFRAPVAQTGPPGATQTAHGGRFGSTQTNAGNDRASSSTPHTGTTFQNLQGSPTQLSSHSARASSTTDFLFGPKFPHLQPTIGPAPSASQGLGIVTAQTGASNPSVSSSSGSQTRNIFGSGQVNITSNGPLLKFAPSGSFGTGRMSPADVLSSDSGPRRLATQGDSSTKTPLDLWLGNHSTVKGSSPATSNPTVTPSAPASGPHFNHSGSTRPAFSLDALSNPLSSSDKGKGKGKEREHDAGHLASDTSGDSSAQFTPSSSEGSQHQGSLQEMFTSTAPSGSREPDSTDSIKAVKDGPDLGDHDEEDDEEFQRRNKMMQAILLEQQQNKRRMLSEFAYIAAGTSTTTTQATAAPQSTASHKSTTENVEEGRHEPPTDASASTFVASAQAAYNDYQTQLVLLEAQNKKRLQMSRSNQGSETDTAAPAASGTAGRVDAVPSSTRPTETTSSTTPYDWTTNSVYMGYDVHQPAGAGFRKYADADTSGFVQAANHFGREGASPFGDGSSFGSQRLLSGTPTRSSWGLRAPQPPKFGVPTPLAAPPGTFPRRSVSGEATQKPRPSDSQ